MVSKEEQELIEARKQWADTPIINFWHDTNDAPDAFFDELLAATRDFLGPALGANEARAETRSQVLDQFAKDAEYFFSEEIDYDKTIGDEFFKHDNVCKFMDDYKDILVNIPEFTIPALEQESKKFVDVLYNNLSQSKMREFLAELLKKDEIVKEFRKTNEERLALILKHAMIKPERLAKILEKDVLNRRTRKPFITSLMEQKKIGKVYKKELKVKKEKPLSKFFG